MCSAHKRAFLDISVKCPLFQGDITNVLQYNEGICLMDSLYNIFQREKNRVGDDMTVFYNKNRNFLQYKNENGTLTVLFKPKERAEDIYYRPNDATEQVDLGTLIQRNTDSGRLAKFGAEIFDLPQEFIDIAQSYQFDREAIGVETPSERRKLPKTKTKGEIMERD